MGSGNAKGAAAGQQQQQLNEEELAAKYRLSPKQIHDLVEAFKSSGKTKVNQKEFVQVALKVKDSHPELARFDDDVMGLVFSFCDVDHDDKLDPLEVVAALATFSHDSSSDGGEEEKAKLVFKTIDRDNSQTLTKEEIRKHAFKVLKLAREITKNRAKKDVMDSIESSTTSALAGFAIGLGAQGLEKKFVEDIVKDIFQSATKADSGVITLEEWIQAARTNNTVRALLSPTICSKAWGAVFGLEPGFEDTAEDTAALLERDPRGFCIIFDKLFQLGKDRLPEVKLEVSLTIENTNGSGESVSKTFNLINETLNDVVNYASEALHLSMSKEDIILCKGDESFSSWELEEPLKKLKLKDGDKLRVENNSSWSGSVIIRTLTGRDIPIEGVSNETLIEKLKEMYQDSEGVPTQQQRLIYHGRQMEDDKSLSYYRVAPNTVIHVVLRLR
eukprot:TRINITY_DN8330_c0_g1_i1.p1 TRINITY_DN8330_c0_g1~~TRINITY_DN8330_c0_g1_i1.p1  ORF type:complete len:445 (-),score=151.78 TRINITY_DN8330_c0_g1_i1:187-1521(-)